MTEQQTKLKRILMLGAVILALALPLMFLLEDFVRDAIVAPTAYLVWLTSVLIDALPESYLLGFATAIVVYVAIRSLSREDERLPQRKVISVPSQGAIAAWCHRLQLVAKGSYSEQRLDHHIGQLMLKVIAYENRCSLREAGQLIENDQVNLPPDLASYLQAALSRRLPRSPNLLERLKMIIIGPRRARITDDDLAHKLAPTLNYLENELKIRPSEEVDE
jgi:hypothetical protein